MSSALPLATPSRSGMSNRTTSPSCFWPASSARVPPICPAPISAIFLRAMPKTPDFLRAARGSAIRRERQGDYAGLSDRMLFEVSQQEFRGLGRRLVHDEMADTGQHFHGEGSAHKFARAVCGIRADRRVGVAPDVERRHLDGAD